MVPVRIALVAWSLTLLGCGRLAFDAVADAARDAPPDGAAVSVEIDFSDAVPYVPADLVDDPGTYDNAPISLCALYPPFAAPLAVVAGRAVIELPTAGVPIVHDYHPGVNDAAGPDKVENCLFATTPSTGGVLWLGGVSHGGGDGLYYVRSDWSLVRDSSLNNVEGIAVDTAGTHTGGAPDVLYVSDLAMRARPSHGVVGGIPYRVPQVAHGPTGQLAAVVAPGDFSSHALARIDVQSLAVTELAQFDHEIWIAIDATPPPGVLAYGIVRARELVAFAPDGSHDVLAAASDPDARWVAVIAPATGHPLAGALYVLETNRALDRDRVLRVVPP